VGPFFGLTPRRIPALLTPPHATPLFPEPMFEIRSRSSGHRQPTSATAYVMTARARRLYDRFSPSDSPIREAKARALGAFTRATSRTLLEATGWNVSAASRFACTDKRNVRRLMKRYALFDRLRAPTVFESGIRCLDPG